MKLYFVKHLEIWCEKTLVVINILQIDVMSCQIGLILGTN